MKTVRQVNCSIQCILYMFGLVCRYPAGAKVSCEGSVNKSSRMMGTQGQCSFPKKTFVSAGLR